MLRYLAILTALAQVADCTYVGVGLDAHPPPLSPDGLSSVTVQGANVTKLAVSRQSEILSRVLSSTGLKRQTPKRFVLQGPNPFNEYSEDEFDIGWLMSGVIPTYDLLGELLEFACRRTVLDFIDWPGEWDESQNPQLRDLLVPGRRVATWGEIRKKRWVQHRAAQANRDLASVDAGIVSKIPTEAPPGLRLLVNGYESKEFEGCRASNDPPILLFQGSFKYSPNLDGANYLIKEILPHMRRVLPVGSQIRLVGKNGHEVTGIDADDVTATGYVERIEDELGLADVCIVPLRHGTGTRLKILEAWSHQIPVVSTSIGADGLGAEDGTHLLIADTPEDFADACLRALSDSDLREHLVANGHRLLLECFDIGAVEDQVRQIVTSLIE
jgi:glycosyltransferase involved in cell wall biosynthesis